MAGPNRGLAVVTGAYQWAYALGGAAVGWAGTYTAERLGGYSAVLLVGTVAAAIWAACLRAALATCPGWWAAESRGRCRGGVSPRVGAG